MTTHACIRPVGAPAYYQGRPAGLWLAALAPQRARRTCLRVTCAETSTEPANRSGS